MFASGKIKERIVEHIDKTRSLKALGAILLFASLLFAAVILMYKLVIVKRS